jgi:putative colanic acid biosynthesis glycosyltransferase
VSLPTIAVVTVCLNDLEGLQKTYESVRAQSLPPLQWIVADGASVDGTVNWLEQLGWAPLCWSSKADGGIYQGMNGGIERAEADYLIFLNSGDALADGDVLSLVSQELARLAERPALLFGDCYEFDLLQRRNLRRARPAWWVWVGMPTTHQAMFFRHGALPGAFDTRYRLCADYAAVSELYRAHRGADFHYLPRPLCHFHLGGRTDQLRQKSLEEMLEIRRSVLGMPSVPAQLLHLAHQVQRWVKFRLPWLHGLIRYG